MFQLPKPHLHIDGASTLLFIESLECFRAGLSPAEDLILSALLHAAMDPWSRSLASPPALTVDEAAALESAVTLAVEGS